MNFIEGESPFQLFWGAFSSLLETEKVSCEQPAEPPPRGGCHSQPSLLPGGAATDLLSFTLFCPKAVWGVRFGHPEFTFKNSFITKALLFFSLFYGTL